MSVNVHPVTVGNTFVKQYYNLLTESPEKLHRFYKDISRFSHVTGSQMEEPISGQKEINDAIMAKNYNGARVDLDNGSIDCHASQNGGVIVMVTGIIKLKHGNATHFVQTFFLAPQPNGYFVLNDVLRFLEVTGALSPVTKVAPAPSPSKATQTVNTPAREQATYTPVVASPASPIQVVKSPKAVEPTPASPTPLSPVKKAISPVAKPATPVKKAVEETKAEEPEAPKNEQKHGVSPKNNGHKAKPHTPKHKPTVAAVEEAPAAASPAGPTSWATRLFGGEAAPAKQATSSPAPAKSPRKKQSSDEATDVTPAPATTAKPRYYSLLIKDLPSQATDADLHTLFGPFGKIATVNITNRGYAFVDYTEPDCVKAVLSHEAAFVLHDQVLLVTDRNERKEGNRQFRDGGRGRGNSGARGGGRNASNRKDQQPRSASTKEGRKSAPKNGGGRGRPAPTN
ncbi:ras GTPase-activating protein-binding protein, partial [Thraustotheca clavata]